MPKRQNGMFAELRRQRIVALIEETGLATVDALCAQFSVSQATIRSDLTALEQLGLVRRTHGGAIKCSIELGRELTSAEKEVRNVRQKRMIAQAALAYVHPGDVIALDTGTTVLELAKLLNKVPDLTVITNDLVIADLLERESEISVTLLGGVLRRHFHCTIGGSIAGQLKNMYVNTLFMATNGMSDKRGFSTASVDVAEAKRALIKAAGKVVVLADSSKADQEAFVSFAALADADVLITDDMVTAEFVKTAEQAGVQVERARRD